MKKKVFITLGLMILLGIIITFTYHFLNRKTYSLNVPLLEELKSISLEQNENKEEIEDSTKRKEILLILNEAKRTTKKESISDSPSNVDDLMSIRFTTKENKISTIYMYKKNNKYYIEQPYNGIYRISKKEYNRILSYLKKEEHSFFGKVMESYSSYIIVEPNEGEEERTNSNSKFRINLEENNDKIYEVGTNVKITYVGGILESNPAQVDTTKIEIKSVDSFALIFHEEPGNVKRQIIDKNTSKKYDYNIYIYNGKVEIKMNSKTYSLEEALKENKITMDEIISQANEEIKNPIMYKDGGSIEYHYDNYTLIKFHTLDGNKDVYIGNKNLKLNDIKSK